MHAHQARTDEPDGDRLCQQSIPSHPKSNTHAMRARIHAPTSQMVIFSAGRGTPTCRSPSAPSTSHPTASPGTTAMVNSVVVVVVGGGGGWFVSCW